MKETAIDYLEEWLTNSTYVENGKINISVKMFKYHVRKAKELELQTQQQTMRGGDFKLYYQESDGSIHECKLDKNDNTQ